MYKKIIPLLIFIFTGLSVFSQNGRMEIKVHIKGFVGDTLNLAYQVADKYYLADTVVAQGEDILFKKDKELPGGIYFVVFNKGILFQFILTKGEQNITFDTDATDYVGKMKIKGSKDNEQFFAYLNYLNEMNKRVAPWRKIQEDLKNQKEDPKYKEAEAEHKKLDDEVKAFQNDLITKYPNFFTGKVIKANMPLDIPEFKKADGKTIDSVAQYNFYKSHYFDGLDWADERFVRTNILDNKIIGYLNNLTVSHPDSMIISVDYMLEQARKNKEVYQYCASALLNHFAASKIICMDKVYVHTADKYYCNKNAPYGGAFWVDEEQLKKICDNADRLRRVMCNEVAPNLILNKLDGTPTELWKVKADYVVVYFWDPDCGNCKKMSARMAQMYDTLKVYGVEVFGICSKGYDEFEKCGKKVEEMKMNWINTGDPYYQARAKQLYDIQMTPFMYLLDKEKKIIYKRIDPGQLKDIVEKDIEKRMKKGEKFNDNITKYLPKPH